MSAHTKLFCFSLLVVIANLEADGARIIGVLSTVSKSRYTNLKNLAEELGSRNNEVLLVAPSTVPPRQSKFISQSIYNPPYGEDFVGNVVSKAFNLSNQSPSDALEGVQMWAKNFVDGCRSVISLAKANFKEWKEFDLIFSDSPPDCGTIISDLLALPHIVICPAFALRLNRGIGPISYIPHVFSLSSDKMNFIERVQNLLHTLFMKFAGEAVNYPRYSELKNSFNITPERPFRESRKMVELVIVMGHFALEYAQPVLPDTKFVGPLTIQSPEKLPLELESFVTGAGDKGVVIFSFGTLGDAVLQKHHVEHLVAAFGRLEQRVVCRLRVHVPLKLPPNVKVLSWIPQNDLLAHHSTKLFISHTGHNSLYESAFHGVPLVCIPLFFDQFSNCVQAQAVGIAVGIDIKQMVEDEIYHKIQLVLNNPRVNATRISAIMRDNIRTPVQKAADWIEYVHRHKGARHLRPQVRSLCWYQEYLLDVGAFLVTSLAVTVFVTRTLCKCMCKLCQRSHKKGEKAKRSCQR